MGVEVTNIDEELLKLSPTPHPSMVSKIPAQSSNHSFHINAGSYIDAFIAG